MHTLIAIYIDFEWDEHKHQVNLRKHGVDFADAVEVFYDDSPVRLKILTITTNSVLS